MGRKHRRNKLAKKIDMTRRAEWMTLLSRNVKLKEKSSDASLICELLTIDEQSGGIVVRHVEKNGIEKYQIFQESRIEYIREYNELFERTLKVYTTNDNLNGLVGHPVEVTLKNTTERLAPKKIEGNVVEFDEQRCLKLALYAPQCNEPAYFQFIPGHLISTIQLLNLTK